MRNRLPHGLGWRGHWVYMLGAGEWKRAVASTLLTKIATTIIDPAVTSPLFSFWSGGPSRVAGVVAGD
jgi:hypothetical protein